MICFGYKDKATQTLSLPGSIYFTGTTGGTREGHGRDHGSHGKHSAQPGQLNDVGFNRQFTLHAMALYRA